MREPDSSLRMILVSIQQGVRRAEVARASRPWGQAGGGRATAQFSFRCLQGSVIIAAFRRLL